MKKSAAIKSLKFNTELVPVGRPNRNQRRLVPTSVTIHNTSNNAQGANAARHSRFVRETGYYTLPSGKIQWVSWHVTVDDGRAIQQLPFTERGIHAGDGNASSIGIEVCMHSDNDQQATNRRTAMLAAILLHDMGKDVTALRTHKSWTGKTCPVLLLPQWDAFKAQVQAALDSLEDDGARLYTPLSIKSLDDGRDGEFDNGEIDHDALEAALLGVPTD